MARPPPRNACACLGCPRPVLCKGVCLGHYQQLRRYPGEDLRPLRPGLKMVRMPGIRLTLPERAALGRAAHHAGISPYAVATGWVKDRLREWLTDT